MPSPLVCPQFHSPEDFVVEVCSEMGRETIQKRWSEISAVLRFSMLTGMPMQLEAALSMLLDFAGEIVGYESALVYFWEENTEHMSLRTVRGLGQVPEGMVRGNIFDLWASKFGRPLMVCKGNHPQSDEALKELSAASVMVIPLVTSHRTLGSMQL